MPESMSDLGKMAFDTANAMNKALAEQYRPNPTENPYNPNPPARRAKSGQEQSEMFKLKARAERAETKLRAIETEIGTAEYDAEEILTEITRIIIAPADAHYCQDSLCRCLLRNGEKICPICDLKQIVFDPRVDADMPEVKRW